MIKLMSVKKSFKNKEVLKDINLEIKENEFIGLKGKSGSGKSTLLSIVGLLESYDGTIEIDNTIITKENKEEKRKTYFSYVFQDYLLIPYLDVFENLILPLENQKIKYDIESINEIIKYLDLNELVHQNVQTLSGGEMQRVAIGRAILSNKKVLLADEPTGNLDFESSMNVLNIFKKIKNDFNISIMMVTHSNEFDDYFDKLYYLSEGIVREI